MLMFLSTVTIGGAHYPVARFRIFLNSAVDLCRSGFESAGPLNYWRIKVSTTARLKTEQSQGAFKAATLSQ